LGGGIFVLQKSFYRTGLEESKLQERLRRSDQDDMRSLIKISESQGGNREYNLKKNISEKGTLATSTQGARGKPGPAELQNGPLRANVKTQGVFGKIEPLLKKKEGGRTERPFRPALAWETSRVKMGGPASQGTLRTGEC